VTAIVCAYVLHPEALWQLKIDLDGGDLPAPADGIAHVHIYFRRIEGALPLGHLVLDARSFQR
jgi:hypothetical protein